MKSNYVKNFVFVTLVQKVYKRPSGNSRRLAGYLCLTPLLRLTNDYKVALSATGCEQGQKIRPIYSENGVDDEIEVPEIELRPNVAQQLIEAREAAGLSIKDIAAKTRVPIRHLENLEAENFSALPGLTYVLGFVRNYARALDLDEQALVDELRIEVSDEHSLRRNYADTNYAPADPAHIPPKSFAWGAIGVLAAILIGFAIFKVVSSGWFAGSATEEIAVTEPAPTAPKPAATAPIGTTSGPVMLTATDEVWLRIYTDDGSKLLERTMNKGESFTIPADAKKPMILTGAPQLLSVTVGGKPVASLGDGERSIKDVDLSPAALLSRAAPADGAATPTTATPNGRI
jgi:cytoskeleton protein RodZ